jgi:hypothetical protein
MISTWNKDDIVPTRKITFTGFAGLSNSFFVCQIPFAGLSNSFFVCQIPFAGLSNSFVCQIPSCQNSIIDIRGINNLGFLI